MAFFFRGKKERLGIKWKLKRRKWKQIKAEELEENKCTNYLYTAEHNTNLRLQVVHTCGLRALTIII